MLSLHGQVSTTSSAAERHAAAQAQDTKPFRKIGAGACGAIFAQDGKPVAIKLAKSDDTALWNDYKMHSAIAKHFAKYEIDNIRIPTCYFFVAKDESEFFQNHPLLTDAAQQVVNLPSNVLVTERILPLPKPARALLIEKYCSPKNKQAALADPANGDCLVRVYLGSWHGRGNGMFFSLRNFKIHLNQMVDLNLDVEAVADRMAIALAIMHWGAKTDARDVEFVLGSATTNPQPAKDAEEIVDLPVNTTTIPKASNLEDFFRPKTELWVLDFNQVRRITMDEAGVAQAVEAARVNDPYFPKPLQQTDVEKKVWNKFVKSYINAARIILGEEGGNLLQLPLLFLQGLVETQREKQRAEGGA